MVIDFFVTLRLSARQWSSISLHQGLCEAMVIDFFPFNIDPLLGIGLICFFEKSEKKIINQSDLSDQDPLHGNGHRIF